ncbi:uncharacterized protein PODANS_1_7720 [Podospora anserina S mat+]|uniref:Podospora anserina S mat+ genomic DNA chromosome 1, supercontig 1 n=1 Tax=Podospora anserina (strain S / ATCC MYA-4624 / DSM 980 / FGSC 10383) TaxID=515849 RepID=B2A8X5_PODAN|nr:uncharacterized protein PODANS_1_7720 [Podospora anserina S mat+]CAP60476.1 unnamed protein product [Podospora anserina S mat+]CDP23121.1 Putative protein of unknown function [Podospora anserina S mat+]
MSSVLGRLPALITILFLALAVSQALCFIAADDDSEADLTRYMAIRSDPVPGTPALLGLTEHIFGVGRRDCLANGTNFCFDNNVDSCSGCGNCCRDGDRKYCCAAGRPCCGSGCCLAGQICSPKGGCVSSVETVTITKTIFETTTRIATQRATILVVKIESSTVVSTVDVTVSSADTQTNIVWKTVTVTAPPAKRSAVLLEVPHSNRNNHPFKVPSITRLFISLVLEKNSSGSRNKRRGGVGGLIPRQNPSTSTITKFVTEIADVVSTTSTTVMAQTTSTFVTTVFQTNTRLILPPLITSTDVSSTPSTSSSPTTTSTPAPSQSLPTTTIAGIAAGTSVLALVLAGLVIFFIRRRRYQTQRPASALFPFDPNDPEHDYQKTIPTTTVTAEPTLPKILPHFAPAAPAHHHSQPPALTPAYQSPPQDQQQQHRRNSSGFTTLVGTPPGSTGFTTLVGTPPGSTGSSSAVLAKGKAKEYRKSGSSSSPPPIAEVQGSEVPVEGAVEVEGSPVGCSGSGSRNWGGRGSMG